MLSRFFLDRPVFAWVIAIVLDGCGRSGHLQAAHSPISAHRAAIHCLQAAYPGASAETVENTVTQIIEQKMTGIDKMLYITSTSDSSGASRIELTFKAGTDPDLAWAKVRTNCSLP